MLTDSSCGYEDRDRRLIRHAPKGAYRFRHKITHPQKMSHLPQNTTPRWYFFLVPNEGANYHPGYIR